MRFVAAYLMVTMGGNPHPSKDDVRAILDSVGAEADEAKLDLLFSQVAGRDVAELMAVGNEMLAFAAPSGGAGPAAGGAAVAAADQGKEEEKAEEKVEEEEEDDNLFSLFD